MTAQTDLKTTRSDNSIGEDSGIERRRRLLKAGLGAVPVLMSLSSRSVFGCETTRPSGFHSINTSSPGSKKHPCHGKSPATWCQQAQNEHDHGWPHGCHPKDRDEHHQNAHNGHHERNVRATTCGDLFGGGMHAEKRCLDVMAGTAHGVDEFSKWCVAGHLNAKAGLTAGACEVEDVRAMWSECNSRGYYEPTAGQQWSKDDCVVYLKTTCA